MVSNKEKFRAVFLLHALGDTIGFKNGDWEFNYHKKEGRKFEFTMELVYEFIQLGGCNDIDLKGWKVSDDTVLHMVSGKGLLVADTPEKIGKETSRIFVEQYEEGMLDGRYPGNITVMALDSLKTKEYKWNTSPYETTKGGSGASMRTSCIGLAYHKPKELSQLIEIAYINSQITHNSAVGILGGITSAYFTSLGFNNVDLAKWPFKLLDLLRSDAIEKVVKKYRPETWKQFKYDQDVFINKWIKYVDMRFDDSRKPVNNKSMRNLIYRSYFYYTNFGYKENKIVFPGSGGDDSVIIAYDCLLDSDIKWETLVLYSMVHMGDSDTTGSIAASWYGALHGFGTVPAKQLEHLEATDMLEDLAAEMYEKFGN